MHVDTVDFFPTYFNFSKVTDSTYLRQAAEDIVSILLKKHYLFAPFILFRVPHT